MSQLWCKVIFCDSFSVVNIEKRVLLTYCFNCKNTVNKIPKENDNYYVLGHAIDIIKTFKDALFFTLATDFTRGKGGTTI